MFVDLANETVVYRDDYKNIKFNTKVSNPDNCKLVVVSNGVVRRLNRIEDNVINPRRKVIFSLNKVDNNDYVVFKVKGNYFDATWGGNVQYLDKRLSNIQEKVFMQATYSFQIYSPEKAVMLIGDSMNIYDRKYLNIKINLKIDNIIKNCIANRLNEVGFIQVQNEISQISEYAESIINETVLSKFGIMVANLNLMLEESDDHYTFRRAVEWNKNITKWGVKNGIV